jgi:2-polyprenyl-3-methyl-5-hydroxy-6-metoxy-1,4-benzoquinol methylase
MGHAERQAALYQGIWSADPEYGTRQGDVIDTVCHRITPHMDRLFAQSVRVVDFGAGDGRFLKALHEVGFCREGLGIDLHKPEKLPAWMHWLRVPLWESISGLPHDYAISTDTLEHMPREMVPAVMVNIAQVPHGFLRISTKQDIYGTERGLHLHETVEEPDWWLDRCRDAGIEPTSWKIYPGSALEVWW